MWNSNIIKQEKKDLWEKNQSTSLLSYQNLSLAGWTRKLAKLWATKANSVLNEDTCMQTEEVSLRAVPNLPPEPLNQDCFGIYE